MIMDFLKLLTLVQKAWKLGLKLRRAYEKACYCELKRGKFGISHGSAGNMISKEIP